MLAVLALYVLAQLALGFWVARRVTSDDDFLVAGRSLGFGLATVSLFATWFGAESCVGAAGTVFEHGVGWHTVEPFAYGLCLVLLGAGFARRLWRRGVTTVADLFEGSFGRATSRLAALVMVPTSLLWAAAQVRAFGHVLAVNADGWFGDEVGLVIAASVVIAYTSLGGLLADVFTDLVQGLLLVLGLVVLWVMVVWQLGGPGAAIERLQELPSRAPPPGSWLDVAEAWAIPVLGSLTAQEAVSRTLAARSGSTARAAGLAGGAIYLLVGLLPVTLGLMAPLLLVDVADAEQVLPSLAKAHMPAFVNLLFAGALVSAMLSTVDSSLLAASSLLTRNLFTLPADADARRRLRWARMGSVGCGLIAFALAHAADGVSELVEQASGFGSAGLFVLFVVAVHGQGRAPQLGALACLGGGLAAWIVGRYWLTVQAPFLLSLGCAAGGLAVGSLLARGRAAALDRRART